MGKPTTKVPVARDAKGRIVGGALNAGGMTSAAREARDAMGLWLCAEPQVETGKAAYLSLLQEGNPVIVKDFMDRVAGKVKEHVEVSGDGVAPEWLKDLTGAAVLAIARGEKPE